MMKRVLLPVALSAMLIPGVASATKMSMTSALERLESNGYKVEEIKHRDTYFHAEVYDRNCQKRHVRVEDNGKILTHDGKPAKNDRYMSAVEIAKMYEGKADVKYVKEIDLHRDHYQVKVKKKDGQTHSMKVDPVTGKQMK
jgi:uncharacterized membrane protein YkoI